MLRLIHLFAAHARIFSIWYALLEVRIYIDIRLLYIIGKPLSKRLLDKKTDYILRWLSNQFSSEITKYSNKQSCRIVKHSPPSIWTCWWQGEDEAPEIVKMCWDSIKKHASGHKLVIISADNYRQFCDVPVDIQKKFEQGLISHQLMSDYVRVNLLNQHGGLWVDATIFACKDIPDIVFSLPVYNVKNIDDSYPLSGRVADASAWQIYFIASQPHSVTYSFISECLTSYWQEFDTPIDYYLTYYLAKIAREQLTEAKREYDQVPPNNKQVELLEPHLLNQQFMQDFSYSSFFNDSTFVYKLSWRKHYPEKTPLGVPSLAKQFLSGQLDR